MGEDLRTLHEGEGRKAQGQRARAAELRGFGEIHTGGPGSVEWLIDDMHYLHFALKYILCFFISFCTYMCKAPHNTYTM